ncbi:MAG: TrkA family potassium uptake protein [Thermoleophilia bacterium]
MSRSRRIAVIGLGQFGGELARSLAAEAEVLAIDLDQKKVDAIAEEVELAVCLDARDFESLSSIVAADLDEAVVSMGGSMESSILATLHLKKIGVPIIRVKANSETHGAILELMGAEEVIFPERETARRMAARMLNPNLLDFVPLEGEYLVRDLFLPDPCVGHTLAELDLRRCLDLFILAVRRQEEPKFVFLPGPDYVVGKGDVMVTIGRESDMERAEAADSLPICPVRGPEG